MKSTYRHLSVRPIWQREFLRWFLAHRQDFAVPVSICGRSDAVLELSFPKLSASACRALRVEIRKNGLSVGVKLHDYW